MGTDGKSFWNVYALELQHILQKHGYHSLDNLLAMGISPVTVERLKLSLTKPPTLPILSFKELEIVKGKARLTEADEQRLKAARLVIPLQQHLYEYIYQNDAHEAAEEAMKVVLRSLETYDSWAGRGPIRDGDVEGMASGRIFDVLVNANASIDEAQKLLAQSREEQRHHAKRLPAAKQARRLFKRAEEEAKNEWNPQERDAQENTYWPAYLDSVRQGQHDAEEQIRDLGGIVEEE